MFIDTEYKLVKIDPERIARDTLNALAIDADRVTVDGVIDELRKHAQLPHSSSLVDPDVTKLRNVSMRVMEQLTKQSAFKRNVRRASKECACKEALGLGGMGDMDAPDARVACFVLENERDLLEHWEKDCVE